MSRITHFKAQSKNIHYWDYYILCHLNTNAALILQRIEYWDGTKNKGNEHAQDINEVLEEQGEIPTQDTSRYFYKSLEELQWEMMGMIGESYTVGSINMLSKELGYLDQQDSPGWDRKKRYCLEYILLQSHIDYLSEIIKFFVRCDYDLKIVFYAIEKLTKAKVYIDKLNVKTVVDYIAEMYKMEKVDEESLKTIKRYKPALPKFIRIVMDKERKRLDCLVANKSHSFEDFEDWKVKTFAHSVNLRNATRKTTELIPYNHGGNSSNYNTDYKQQLQNSITESGNIISTLSQEEIDLIKKLRAGSSSPSLPGNQEDTETPNNITQFPSQEREKVPQKRESEGGSKVIHIADTTTSMQPTLFETEQNLLDNDSQMGYSGKGKRTRRTKEQIAADLAAKEASKKLPPVAPTLTAEWNAETAVMLVEAKLGKHYAEGMRKKQLGFAKRMFEEDSTITREQFEAAYNDRNDQWWNDTVGPLHLQNLVEKDRIHTILLKLGMKAKGQGKSSTQAPTNPKTTDMRYVGETMDKVAKAYLEEENNEFHMPSEAEIASFMVGLR